MGANANEQFQCCGEGWVNYPLWVHKADECCLPESQSGAAYGCPSGYSCCRYGRYYISCCPPQSSCCGSFLTTSQPAKCCGARSSCYNPDDTTHTPLCCDDEGTESVTFYQCICKNGWSGDGCSVTNPPPPPTGLVGSTPADGVVFFEWQSAKGQFNATLLSFNFTYFNVAFPSAVVYQDVSAASSEVHRQNIHTHAHKRRHTDTRTCHKNELVYHNAE